MRLGQRGRGWLNIFSQSRVILFPTSSTGERQLHQCYQSVFPLCLERKLKLTGSWLCWVSQGCVRFHCTICFTHRLRFFSDRCYFRKKNLFMSFLFLFMCVYTWHTYGGRGKCGMSWFPSSAMWGQPLLSVFLFLFFFGVVK